MPQDQEIAKRVYNMVAWGAVALFGVVGFALYVWVNGGVGSTLKDGDYRCSSTQGDPLLLPPSVHVSNGSVFVRPNPDSPFPFNHAGGIKAASKERFEASLTAQGSSGGVRVSCRWVG